jgi:esterase/lipase superfamily enzyme
MYTASYFFPNYNDPLIYENSPEDYLAGMPDDHPYLDMYRRSDIVLCVGQGAWEDDMITSTSRMEDILAAKGIPAWVDYWGYDVNHDWPWWQRQLPYFMGYLL